MTRIETVEIQPEWMRLHEAPKNTLLIDKEGGHWFVNSEGTELLITRDGIDTSDCPCSLVRVRLCRPDELPDFTRFCHTPKEEPWRTMQECPEGVIIEATHGRLYYKHKEGKALIIVFDKNTGEIVNMVDRCHFRDSIYRPRRDLRIVIGDTPE